MTDKKMPKSNADGDSDVRRLMTAAGRRPEPPPAMSQRVHRAVLQAWQETPAPAAESAFRYGALSTIAAGLLVCAVALYSAWLLWPPATNTPLGELVFASGGYSIHGKDKAPFLFRGARLQTATDGRLMVRLDARTTLRLDHNTRATLTDQAVIQLHRGRIYIDSPEQNSSLRVLTRLGAVSDIGTQFAVAVEGEELTVAVREGQVNVDLEREVLTVEAEAGMGGVVTISENRQIERSRVATTDRHWSWIHLAAADFDLGAGSLHDFLVWASRETGLELHFSSDAARLATQHTRLHGNIEGIAPLEAIHAVLATTSFTIESSLPHELVIGFKR